MTEFTINPRTPLRVTLTPIGMDILTAESTTPELRAVLVSNGHSRRKFDRPTTVTMQLWELIMVFGPYVATSFRVPFLGIEVDIESERERGLVEQLHEVRGQQVACAQEAEAARRVLRDFGKIVTHVSDYTAPEDVQRMLADWVEHVPPRIPNEPGLWFHGEHVVEVQHRGLADEELPWPRTFATAPGTYFPVVVRRNGRRTPVEQMADEWGGPARRDPRCQKPRVKIPSPQDTDDEDIPF